MAPLDPTTMLATVLEGMGQPFYAVDANWRITHYNSDAALHFGRPASQMIGTTVWENFPQDVGQERHRILNEAMRERRILKGETLSMTGRYVSYVIFPLGEGLGILVRDVSDRRSAEAERDKAEAAARQHTAVLEAVLEAIPTAVWFTNDPQARTLVGNRRSAELLRLPDHAANTPRGPVVNGVTYWKDGCQLERGELPLQRAARGEVVSDELIEICFDNGERRTLLFRAAPLGVGGGSMPGAVCAAADVTERLRYEARLKLLLDELDHRVKNTLATVQSIAAQSLHGAKTFDEAGRDFEGRLMALSRVHDTLTRAHWTQASLREVIEKATAPFRKGPSPAAVNGEAGGERLALDGPDVTIPPKAALALALGLHELCTNAVKYGALSVPKGQVAVEWNVLRKGDASTLDLSWIERGGPAVQPPARRGFGTRLVEEGLAQELEGAVTLDFQPAGLRCRIAANLPPPL